MSGTSLQPQYGNRYLARRQQDEGDPLLPFRRQISRLFDDFFSGPMFPRLPIPGQLLDVVVAPQIDVSETDKEIRVTAELPGIDPKDVEITLIDDVLAIRGEKRAERDEGDGEGQQGQQGQQGQRNYHVSERAYGRFARFLRLPFHANPEQVRASFKDGVLTVTIPKPEEAQQKVHRISVSPEQQAAGQGATQQAAQGSTSESASGQQAGQQAAAS